MTQNLLANPIDAALHSLTTSARILARIDDPKQVRAVEQAMILVDSELVCSEEIVERFSPEIEDSDARPVPRVLLLPSVQRAEIHQHADMLADLELEAILPLIPAGQRFLVAQEAVALIAEINEQCQITGTEEIFKFTTRIARVAAELPLAVAVNERTFADFIDDLYWLLYESPGSRSPRYLTKNGGPLADSECAIVFVINRLRNYFRHDPEHGSDGEIKRKFDRVRDDLSERGFDRLPRTRMEYQRLQRILLEESLAFLKALIAAV